MNKSEKRTIFSLSLIYAFRMLGLFMILPVFSLYAERLDHATLKLVGIALGIYGLTQALLQIPLGMTSDRIGRKPVIIFGLLLFAIGSVVAALSHSIYGIIIGRALQGGGAIGSTLTALLADNTEDENRLKAMSMIGMTIGLSFMVAIVLGPFINSYFGLSGIFWLTAILALVGIVMVVTIVPNPPTFRLHRDTGTVTSQFKSILSNDELLRLDLGIFVQHATLTALFIIFPLLLVKDANLHASQQWMMYLPILVLAFFAMIPFIIIAEAKRKMKPIFVGAIAALTLSISLLYFFKDNVIMLGVCLFLFFTAFTLLEASLPSLVSKIAPAGSKGTAMGVYSTSQFLGIFLGGVIGGFAYHHYGDHGVFAACILMGLMWLVTALTMKKPQHLSSKVVSIAHIQENDHEALLINIRALDGVSDVQFYHDEQVAYLKVDKKVFSENQLNNILSK